MKKFKFLLPLAILALTASSCDTISNVDEEDPIVEEDDTNEDIVSSDEGEEGEELSYVHPDLVTIYYHRDDNAYEEKRLWLWSENSSPETEFELTDDGNDWSWSYTFDTEELFGNSVDTYIGFLFKQAGSWSWQTSDMYVYFDEYGSVEETADDGSTISHLYLYVVAGSGTTHTVYNTSDEAKSDRISAAFISSNFKKINIYTEDGTGNDSSIIDSLKIYKFTNTYAKMSDTQKGTYKSDYLIYSASNVGKDKLAIEFSKTLTINCIYTIEATFVDKPSTTISYNVTYDNLYDLDRFQELNYDGDDLGAVIHDDSSTTFKLWAPTASRVQLRIYDYGYNSTYLPEDEYLNGMSQTAANLYKSYDMEFNLTDFVWEYEFDENLNGKYYTYYITNTSGSSEVVDPYAKSAGMDGKRGMVIDFDSEEAQSNNGVFETIPDVWDGVEGYDIESTQELIVSEIHIRDLTMNETWGGTDELAGTYEGFIETGTTYTNASGTTVSTGFDHLTEYGVNAVQLLPIFDQDNSERGRKTVTFDGDDTTYSIVDYDDKGDFNWGYNPLNYNVLEGQYSSDPTDGFARVKEFKDLVGALATNGNYTRVIMDVVYNHVSSAPSSNFEKIMPGYYFRYNEDGSYANASGTGNEVKTEAYMMRKFIVDSVTFWAKTYKIKGFRFDLMGAIDLETMSQVANALYAIDPDIVVYGEGWYATSPVLSGDQLATNANIATYLYPGRADDETATYSGNGYVGGFNNGGRDALKGDNTITDSAFWGFIGRGDSDMTTDIQNRVQLMMMGANGYDGCPWNPLQNVNYVSCHDNYTLFDQLNYILSPDGGTTAPNITDVMRASASVNGMVLMSNALSFINGGEEIFRTKIEYDETLTDTAVMFAGTDDEVTITHNSYKSSDLTNSYDYSRKADYYEYFEMYKDLVALAKTLDYSSEVVSGEMYSYYVGTGEDTMGWIEGDNTYSTQIGVVRKTKDGDLLHIYLNGRDDGGADFIYEHAYQELFNNGGAYSYYQGLYIKDPYSLLIVKE